MIEFDFSNLFSDRIGKENGLSNEDIAALEVVAPDAHGKIEGWRKTGDALFFDIVFDKSVTLGLVKKAGNVAENFDNLVVLGIGGSALGTSCITKAMLPPFFNLLDRAQRKGRPRIFVCDNTDPDTFSALFELVDIKKTCFAVISKSGKTLETAAQFSIAISRLKKNLGTGWQKNLVIITDPTTGELRPFAEKEGISNFPIPPKLGGRFSALSAVSLFPAACVGIDIEELVGGARAMAEKCAGADIKKNPAYQIGGYHHILCARKKKPISVMMPYSDALSLFADWYSQLWAESLGKDGKGQTPVKALGATDQHSQLQLYMEGPNDKIVTFIGAKKFRSDPNLTKITETTDSFAYLAGRDFAGIINAEREATASALASAKRPNMTVILPSISARHVGELFMAYEIATAFAGALLGINPFDQPGVEEGKRIARKILTAD